MYQFLLVFLRDFSCPLGPGGIGACLPCAILISKPCLLVIVVEVCLSFNSSFIMSVV